MGKRKHDPLQFVELAARGLSNRAIGRITGVNESSVRRSLESVNYKRFLVPENVVERMNIELEQPIRLYGDVMITADWHIPLYDPAYVNYMIGVARDKGLRNLILGGDFFNFDALSAYDPKQESAGLEGEIVEANRVMESLLESFDSIVYIWGNHDARLHRALGYKIQFAEGIRRLFGELGSEALDKIQFSSLDHCWINDEWYVCHPASYSQNPLYTARRISAKTGTHVITAHAHHCAVGYATDGQHVVADIGGLFDKDKTGYLQRTTTFPNWTQGFAYLMEGKLRVHSPGWRLE